MNREFEKYIRKTLQDQEDYVDAEAIWQHVEPHVGPEKKRRRFFWWFFSGALAGVMAVGLWFYTQQGSDALGSQAEVSDNVMERATTTIEQPVNLEEGMAMLNLEESENNNANTSFENTNESQVSITEATVEKVKDDNPLSLESLNNATTINDVQLNHNNKNTKIEKVLTNGSAISGTNPKKPNQKTLSEFLQEDIYRSLSKEPLSSVAVDLLAEEGVVTRKENVVKGKEDVMLSTELMMNSLLAKVEAEENLEEDLIPESHQLIVPVHQQKKWNFAFGLYAGLGSVNDDFQNTDIEENYLSDRKNSETQLESSSFGLSFTARARQKLTMRTGLEYHRIARRLNYEETTVTYDTIPDAILRIYVNTSNGDTLYDVGKLVNESSEDFEKEHFNYFHRLDIPLLVGYHFNYRKFAIGAEVGVYANVLLRRKGAILDERAERTFYDIKSDVKGWYKTNVGFTPVAQLSIGYRLSPRVELQASPYYRFRSVYSTSSSLLKETYSDIGIQLGLKYWLK